MKTIKIATCCIVLLVLSTTWAAAQMVVFHSDFDLDTVGAEPATDLPGDPDGDYLALYSQGGTISVESSYLGLDQQPVVLTRQSTDSFGIQFWIDPDLEDCEVFTISWRLVLNSFVQFCYLSFQSPNNRVMGSVEFRDDGLMTANSSANVLSTTYAPGVPQLIELRLDMLNETISVAIDGVPDPQGQNLVHNQAGGDGLRLFSLAFGMLDTYSVAVDDLHVTGSECVGVPVEETSWSGIKAMYR